MGHNLLLDFWQLQVVLGKENFFSRQHAIGENLRLEKICVVQNEITEEILNVF